MQSHPRIESGAGFERRDGSRHDTIYPLIKFGVRMTVALIEKCNSMLHKRIIGSAAVKQFVAAHDAACRNHGVDRFARGNAQRMEQPNVLRGRLLAPSQQGAGASFDGLARRAGATRFQVLFHLRRADSSAISVTIGGQVRPTGCRIRLADESALRDAVEGKGAALSQCPATQRSDLVRRAMRQYRQVRCTKLAEEPAGRLP